MREWLGAMATGGRRRATTRGTDATALPAEHAALLTRAARAEQPGRQRAVDAACWARSRTRSSTLRARRRRALRGLPALPRGDGRGERPDRGGGARRAHPAARARPDGARSRAGIDVLDVGCGRGRALDHAGREPFPAQPLRRLRPLDGGDRRGPREARGRGPAQRSASRCSDVAALDDERRFDLVTAFDAIHDQARPDRGAREHRARRCGPAGVFLMQDIAGVAARRTRTSTTRSARSSTRSRACTA